MTKYSEPRWAADLDGTLVDTRTAVEEAYKAVGVTPPEGFWGCPWTEWLSDPIAHERKAIVYPTFLSQHGRLLPLAQELVQQVKFGRTVQILTGASLAGYRAALRLIPVSSKKVFFQCGLTGDQKIQWLQQYSGGVYWDDDERFLERVARETAWTPRLAPR